MCVNIHDVVCIKLTRYIDCINGGPRLPLLFTSHSYRHLEGHFLAEMAGQQIGLNGKETKLA